MSAPVDAGVAPVTDPRVGQLLDLVQGLLQGYGELATAFAAHVPNAAVRDQFMNQAQGVIEEGRRRYGNIAVPRTAAAPPVR